MNARRETRDERRDASLARVALASVASGVALVATAYASAWAPGGTPIWGVWLMIGGSAGCIGGATMLGATNSHLRRRTVVFLGLFLLVIIVAGFGLPVLLPPDAIDAPLVLGLPLRVAIEVYGVGILPIVVLPIAYAIEFRADDLDAAALADLRHRCELARAS